MMDSFLEEVAVARNKTAQTVLYLLANLVMALCAVMALMYFFALTPILSQSGLSTDFFLTLLRLAIFGGAAVFLFFYRDRVKTEYEYTFTNGQMDFAQVFNNNKRKNLGTMNLRNVEACGMVASGSFNRYINMQNLKRSNWFLNRDADLLYFFFQKEGQKRIIIIEPSEEMTALIKKSLSQGAWQIN